MKTRWMEHESPSNDDMRDEILRLLMTLKKGESIDPSDAARAFGSGWRKYMKRILEVAADLVRDGNLEIIQRGELIDVDSRNIHEIRGPIRFRLKADGTWKTAEYPE